LLHDALDNLGKWHDIFNQCNKQQILDVVLYNVIHDSDVAKYVLPNTSIKIKKIPKYTIRNILGVDVPGLTDVSNYSTLEEDANDVKFTLEKYPKARDWLLEQYDKNDVLSNKVLSRVWKIVYRHKVWKDALEKKQRGEELKKVVSLFWRGLSKWESTNNPFGSDDDDDDVDDDDDDDDDDEDRNTNHQMNNQNDNDTIGSGSIDSNFDNSNLNNEMKQDTQIINDDDTNNNNNNNSKNNQNNLDNTDNAFWNDNNDTQNIDLSSQRSVDLTK